ncbi:hypothetical protein RhiirC2_359819 [Rhizophagus irregularis]|uniref:F-box domain-containing protein n=1 Tax=Rhizophagus irregularis TaxID=588596 RepID=A0A2N1NGJ3_9GLOM|nr:hypothetical protein RhiirC2_359819 [Rhizophagus irregularis]
MSEAVWNCVGSQRPMVKRCNSLTASASQSSLIVDIPCEVFIDICKFLPPLDLFTLSLVCKNFRNWLVARSNFGTEQIWRTARINWLTHLRSPPNGMPEQCYVFLHLIELGCQFCGNGKIDPHGGLPCEIPARIYWCFRVRCCQKCLLERTVTSKQIKEEGKVHSDLLRILPHYFKNNRPHIYWRSQVEAAYQEYVNLDRKDFDKWIYDKSIQLEEQNKIAAACAGSTQAELKKNQIGEKLKMLIRKLSLVVPNDANRTQRQVEVELKRCATYKKYTTNNNNKANFLIRLFNEDHWDLFQNLIRQEYEEKRKYAALRAQQFDIFYIFNGSRKIFHERSYN